MMRLPAILVLVVCFLAAGCTELSEEYQRSGNPALKLEVRRASTKAVDGWTPQKEYPLYVSPEVELSNEDVLTTGVRFAPIGKAVSRWKGGATFLLFSVFFFVVCWRSKDDRWWSGVSGVVCLLVGVGTLWHGLTSTAQRFEQQGSWQVVIRFNDAGKKKLADLTASMADTQKYPPNRRPYPSNHLAFLIDGELTFAWPVMEQVTDGLFDLVHSTHLTMRDAPEGPSEEYATWIAKGIVGP